MHIVFIPIIQCYYYYKDFYQYIYTVFIIIIIKHSEILFSFPFFLFCLLSFWAPCWLLSCVYLFTAAAAAITVVWLVVVSSFFQFLELISIHWKNRHQTNYWLICFRNPNFGQKKEDFVIKEFHTFLIFLLIIRQTFCYFWSKNKKFENYSTTGEHNSHI